MIEKVVSVTTSLEARPAALFVQAASKFESSIKIQVEEKTINAKSIMGLISLGILDGNVVTIIADGKDEEEAVNELTKFLKG